LFKTAEKSAKGEAAREQILGHALRLFREGGFDATTMREVAASAGAALGLAYYYFPSKEALVAAYYDQVQARHAAMLEEELPHTGTLAGRLSRVFHSKIDILQDDRKLLGALFRYTGDPDHPLSFLGKATQPLRAECMELFRRAVEPERLPRDLAELLPMLLWAMQMGILLFFLYDGSPNAQRTRRLIDGSVGLVVRMLTLAKFPLLRPLRKHVLGVLKDAGLAEPTLSLPFDRAQGRLPRER
jgi:AcrR family transcriptional regulator